MHANPPQQLVRRINLAHPGSTDVWELLRREWLVTNGLGGYASGSISGCVSRRYHGLLVAALPAPLGRVVMFNHLAEFIQLPDGQRVQIGGEEPSAPRDDNSPAHHITEFRLEHQLPVWRIEAHGVVLEKRMLLLHGQNTVQVTYTLLSEHDDLRLELRPSFNYRPHENDVAGALAERDRHTIPGEQDENSAGP